MLSQHLNDRELAAVVSRFEELAHDIVTSMGGRVVKMIGDEAMFVVSSAADAARIGLALAEAYADDALLSDVRVALAIGPVLVQDGDFYGPVVNLASRLVGIANPGTVLMSDEIHQALAVEAPGEFASRALRPRTVKDIGRVQVWRLSREGGPTGADRRRTVPWERLGDVLRELDELRDKGGRALGDLPADRPVIDQSSRRVAMPWGRSSKRPSNGTRGRPRRSTSQPDRPSTATVVGRSAGLNTRTSRAPASRRTAETSAPVTVRGLPEAGRVPPPKDPTVASGTSTSSATRYGSVPSTQRA